MKGRPLPPRLVAAQAMADHLGVSVALLRALVREQRVPFVETADGEILSDVVEVDAWRAESRRWRR